MSKRLNRREFVRATTAAGVTAAAASRTLFAQSPAVLAPKSVKPVVIASANGNRYKNGGTQTSVERAFAMITGGADVLDALIAGVNILELDPEDTRCSDAGLEALYPGQPTDRAAPAKSIFGVNRPRGSHARLAVKPVTTVAETRSSVTFGPWALVAGRSSRFHH